MLCVCVCCFKLPVFVDDWNAFCVKKKIKIISFHVSVIIIKYQKVLLLLFRLLDNQKTNIFKFKWILLTDNEQLDVFPKVCNFNFQLWILVGIFFNEMLLWHFRFNQLIFIWLLFNVERGHDKGLPPSLNSINWNGIQHWLEIYVIKIQITGNRLFFEQSFGI